MVFAWSIGKRRVAADILPAFWPAWGLVLLDATLIVAVLTALFLPIMTFIYATQPSTGSSGFFMFVLYIVFPLMTLINGVIWTRRSRLRY